MKTTDYDILQKISEIDHQLAELRILVRKSQEDHPETVKDPNAIPIMLTINQAVEKTGLSYDYLRKLCLQGKIAFVKVGSKYLINQEKLALFLNGE